MSTLTSSPSPAASPRAAFHIQRPSGYTAPSPRSLVGTAKRTSWNAPPPPPTYAAPKQAAEKGGAYTDAGTQYSPEGYPPTAGNRAIAGGKAAQPLDKGKEKKRKERGEDSPEPMSTSTASSSGSSVAAARHPPAEPEPRIDPRPAAAPQQSEPRPNEPQEARSTAGHSSAPKRSRPTPGDVKLMPTQYETCNPKDLGVLISNMLMELIRLNDQIPLRDGRLTRFHSRAPPGISVADYLQRIIHHATLSPPIMLSMVWYIDRLCQLYPAFTINSLTVHRFLITAVTVAAKGLSDSFWTNPVYARIGGIPVSELATLELEFLQKVQWKIVPQPEVLEDYYRSLVERTEGFALQGCNDSASRGTSVGSSDEGSGSVDGTGVGTRVEGADEIMTEAPT